MKKRIIIAWFLIMAVLLTACAGSSDEASYDSQTQNKTTTDESYTYETEAGGEMGDYAATEGYSISAESYLTIDENKESYTADESLMTFSLKVDTAAYTNVARYIESGNLPPTDAVRTEELINYFSYDGDMSYEEGPFGLSVEIGDSPFSGGKKIALVRVKTEEIDTSELPSSNLTFLIDTSGSMDSYDKLPLLKEAFSMLVETLDEDDKVSIVTYAGSSSVVLDSASGADKDTILKAIHNLEAGGSTAGADGINTAYALAEKNYREGGNNRVILATDGDFNVGISDTESLEQLVSEKRDNGVYLSILGFGTGNIRDDIMETLSTNGNGNYSYINSASTAEKVLVEELGTNLFTVADDVKAQIEFNPETVKSYRLIGYENRKLSNEDFEDDTKDAGEVGAGTDVVILLELELQGAETDDGGSEDYKKYGNEEESAESDTDESHTAETAEVDFSNELMEIRIRYKDPGESESKLITNPVYYDQVTDSNSTDFKFACSVAGFGHLLRDSEYSGDITVSDVLQLAQEGLGQDDGGYRQEYLELLRQYQDLVG